MRELKVLVELSKEDGLIMAPLFESYRCEMVLYYWVW